MTGHRTQLRFAHEAKILHVADEAFTRFKAARERLVDQVFEGVQKLSAFAAKESGVVPVDIQNAPAFRLGGGRSQIQSHAGENLIQKILRLFEDFSHRSIMRRAFKSAHVYACDTLVVPSLGFLGFTSFFFPGGSSSSPDFTIRLMTTCCPNPTMLPTSQ